MPRTKKIIIPQTNYEIIRAENGQKAADIVFVNSTIDIVLMVIKMPVMNGYEAIEKINVVRTNLPIIAQTAHASEEDKDKVNTMGFTDYITEPINKDLFLQWSKNTSRLFKEIILFYGKKVI
jgi:CheY-like chemotaxis protein